MWHFNGEDDASRCGHKGPDSATSLARILSELYKRDEHTVAALNNGVSEMRIKNSIAERVQSEVRGRREDEFYLKVKALLDTEGEVSDAIGRLTDREVYDKLSYEDKQRYTMEISAKYLAALNRYKKEKELKL